MAVETTLRTELSREGLLALRRDIDELLAGNLEGGTDARPAPQEASTATAAQKVHAILARLGGESSEFLRTCAEHFQDGEEFGLEDIAAARGVDVSAVKAHHRNVARSERQEEQLHPGAPPLLEGRYAGTPRRRVYTMPSAVRQAVLAEYRQQ